MKSWEKKKKKKRMDIQKTKMEGGLPVRGYCSNPH